MIITTVSGQPRNCLIYFLVDSFHLRCLGIWVGSLIAYLSMGEEEVEQIKFGPFSPVLLVENTCLSKS